MKVKRTFIFHNLLLQRNVKILIYINNNKFKNIGCKKL
jgi:hypothetical protein